MKVLVLGAGKMLEAILVGLSASQDLKDWGLYSPSGVSASKLAASIGAQWVQDLDQVKPDLVIVGCKPQQLKDLKLTIGDRFKGALFVSVLAAISEKDQLNILGASKLIRIMPNLPVRYGKGVSLIASESAAHELDQIQKLFSNLGMALVLSEIELEELTLLTGSGPAFFYEFTKNLAEGFTSLNQNKREELSRFVLMGAAHSASLNQDPLDKMISEVTSKGGVTIAVLERWRESKLFSVLKTGIEAGKKRSAELRDLIRQS